MAMVYKWKVNKFPVSAQVAGEELQKIEQEHGYIKPDVIVEKSKPKKAPLHKCFEWDDGIAAEEYRKVQAKEIIRFITIEHEEGEQPIRAFWSVHPEAEEEIGSTGRQYAYKSIGEALKQQNYKDYILSQALRELEAFERKYKHLSELAGVMREIERIKDREAMAV